MAFSALAPTHEIGFLHEREKRGQIFHGMKNDVRKLKSEWTVHWDTSTPYCLFTLPRQPPSPPPCPYILICVPGISSQISHLHPSLVWDSALGKRQTKTVSSTMRPSFSTGCATASGEWWRGMMMEGTDFSQMSHLTLSKPKRDLPQPMIHVSKKVGLCLEQESYAGLGLVTWHLIVENLYCQVNELLLYSSPLLLDKSLFYPIVCFWIVREVGFEANLDPSPSLHSPTLGIKEILESQKPRQKIVCFLLFLQRTDTYFWNLSAYKILSLQETTREKVLCFYFVLLVIISFTFF